MLYYIKGEGYKNRNFLKNHMGHVMGRGSEGAIYGNIYNMTLTGLVIILEVAGAAGNGIGGDQR